MRKKSEATTDAVASQDTSTAVAPLANAQHAAAGTQSIGRTLAVLRLVAAAGPHGVRVTEIATQSGLHVATVHRLLAALARERFLMQDPATKRYASGPELLSMAFNSRQHYGLGDRLLPMLERLANATGDVIYATIRAGNEAICLARREGSYPIRALSIGPGDRRPLGVGAGSLALLASLLPEERDAIIASNAALYGDFGMTTAYIASMCERAAREGFALNDGRIIEGMSAVALPLLSVSGRPVAAISTAAIDARMTPQRRPEIVDLMKTEIAALGPLPD